MSRIMKNSREFNDKLTTQWKKKRVNNLNRYFFNEDIQMTEKDRKNTQHY